MKFMLMMHTPAGTGDYQINDWSPEDFKAHMTFMHTFNKKLAAGGEFVGAEGLAAPGDAKIVKAARDGTPITDGVFPEAKEFLAGYWIVDVDSAARAYQLAAEISAAPGPRGAPLNMNIEVRQVMSGLPTDV